jgi:hypothetical protein
MLFSATASADDHHTRRNWDRNDHHSDRRDRWDGREGRWDDRRYHHSRPTRYWVPPGHRYYDGYRYGNRYSPYHGGYYGSYYGGRDYCPPRYRRSAVDATLIFSFPIW